MYLYIFISQVLRILDSWIIISFSGGMVVVVVVRRDQRQQATVAQLASAVTNR